MSSACKRRSCLAKRSSRSSSCGEPRAIMQLPSPTVPKHSQPGSASSSLNNISRCPGKIPG